MSHDDERDIYLAAQSYRNWPIGDQQGVKEAFEKMVATIWNTAINDAIKMGPTGIIAALKIQR